MMLDVKRNEPRVVTGKVLNGRLVIDAPADRPDGTEVELMVIRLIRPSGEVVEGEALDELLR